MLKLDLVAKSLTPLAKSTMADSSILERADLQHAIRTCWEAFRNEMGMPDLILLGEEIQPHGSCKDRIDLLALDVDGRLVIIELKRGRERLQLMQAIAYAGMVAEWDEHEFRRRVLPSKVPQWDEVEALLKCNRVKFDQPRVILMAELYDPEVIIGAHWLTKYGVPIMAYAVNVTTLEGNTFLSLDQRYPLPELKDVYVARSRPPDVGRTDIAWSDVLPAIKLPWARHAVEALSKVKSGDPVTRRFGSIFSGGPLGPLQINIGNQHLKVYTRDQTEEQADRLRAMLGPIPFTTWGSDQTANSGYTFALKSQSEFDRFVATMGSIR